MSPTVAWFAVAGNVVGLAVGQVLFKFAAAHINEREADGLGAWLNVPVVAALAVYAVCTVLWITALRALPLRIAYPFSALGFFLVPVFAHLWLHEPLRWQSFGGAMLIVAGIALAASADG
jgi:undecaprenyl phosphate-alpha-L-ara4N flippase subunit ArnE